MIVVLMLLSITGCSDTFIDPFENDEAFYSIYGYLDPLQRKQQVRIVNVQRNPERITIDNSVTRNFGGIVVSTDLRDSTQLRWDHRLERLEDGTYGHVFEAFFTVRPGRTYRLEVIRNDGTITWAETTIPRFPATVPDPDTLFFPYESSPDEGLTHDVVLPGIASPWNMVLTYDLQGTFIRVPYGRTGERTAEGNWRFTVDMGADAPQLRQSLGLSDSDPLPLLHAINLDVQVLDASWDPPNGVFDPAELARPGTFSNVQNGYGYWGSVTLYQYTWIAPPGSQ